MKLNGPKVISGQKYPPGVHDLSDHADHWYLKAMLKTGEATLLKDQSKSETVKLEDVQTDDPLAQAILDAKAKKEKQAAKDSKKSKSARA